MYGDYKNITHKLYNTDRVPIWRLILEEHGPYI